MPLMLQNIPTHVIAGPLGAGKTSLIKHLLAQRPANERWAVLINEFGQIGLDAALLTQDDDGIARLNAHLVHRFSYPLTALREPEKRSS